MLSAPLARALSQVRGTCASERSAYRRVALEGGVSCPLPGLLRLCSEFPSRSSPRRPSPFLSPSPSSLRYPIIFSFPPSFPPRRTSSLPFPTPPHKHLCNMSTPHTYRSTAAPTSCPPRVINITHARTPPDAAHWPPYVRCGSSNALVSRRAPCRAAWGCRWRGVVFGLLFVPLQQGRGCAQGGVHIPACSASAVRLLLFKILSARRSCMNAARRESSNKMDIRYYYSAHSMWV